MGRFGVGQGLRRIEDARLLTGGGHYTDDIVLPGQAFAAFVRSPHAHAAIGEIQTDEAAAMPGVLGIYTAVDLDAAGVGDIPCLTPMRWRNGQETFVPPHPALARGRARYVGEPVAVVVAEDVEAARAAAELVEVDYDELPAIADTGGATDPEAPVVWDRAPGNVALEWELGQEAPTEEGIAKADHVTSLRLINNRLIVNPLEPRGAIGDYDPEADRLTLYCGSQGVYRLMGQIRDEIFKVPQERLRIVCPDVGGGFGMKIFLFSEYIAVLFAARALKRPVKWIAERTEGFLSDSHGRDHVTEAKLALDREGRILAIRVDTLANMGAYLSNFAPLIPTAASIKMLSGLYRIPAGYGRVQCIYTNTVPVDAYRGAGRPEAAYLVERLIDQAARELGLAPDEIRRRNFIQPSDMPYETCMGISYDSGDFPRLLQEAMEQADWAGAAARKAEAARKGLARGIGLATYVEACSGVGEEMAVLKLDEDGGLTVRVGTQTNGQGHATAYAQLVNDRLGIDPDKVRVLQGDSDILPGGGGTGGSRSLLMGGMATVLAADKLVERVKEAAGHLLEASNDDLELADGEVRVIGTDRRVSLAEVAAATEGRLERADLNPLDEAQQRPLEDRADYKAPSHTYPNGCHVCELEVDPATGVVTILRYVVVDDFGALVNPMLVKGQVYGGIAQGVGQALLERTVFDPESGQLLTGSLMDYCMPRADDLPDIEITLIDDIPCTTNPLGIKGAGEAGAIGSPPAVMNALLDALRPLGVEQLDMPATPDRVWNAIQQAARGAEPARAAE